MRKPDGHNHLWYGKFETDSPARLIAGLETAGKQFAPLNPFRAYFIDQHGEKHYGLDLLEWGRYLSHPTTNLETAAASVSQEDGRIIRVSLRAQPGSKVLKGQFVIASADETETRFLYRLITGKEADHLPTGVSSSTQIGKDLLRARWLVPYIPAGLTYRRPVLTLFDQFYFDRDVEFDHLLGLLDRISADYLDGDRFHMRLKTTDGDFYLNLDRIELRYLLGFQRERILLLYLDAATREGQWVNLRLSFHPLLSGPNAEIELTSFNVEEIMELIQDHLGAKTWSAPATPYHIRYTFRVEDFSVQRVCQVMEELTREHLQRIPPVAFLSTLDGTSYTGLSLFQLERIWQRHASEVSVLSLGITREVTGQTMSLMYRFTNPNEPSLASLSIHWGENATHQLVDHFLRAKLFLNPEP